MRIESETAVLVVGGGIVGLTTALLLQQHGIPFILIERETGASPLPRARGWAVRSMEIWRQLGLQQIIEQEANKAWEQGVFGGARKGGSMLSSIELNFPSTDVLTGLDPSPCKMVACPQTRVEPILKAKLEASGGDLRFGWTFLNLSQTHTGVTASVQSPTGSVETIAAEFLVASDGSRSSIRHLLNIVRTGSTKAQSYVNVYFECDLEQKMRGRTFSQCEIDNEVVSGIFLSMNNTTRWSFHIRFDPHRDAPDSWTDEHVIGLLHSAIGEELPIKLLHRGVWLAADRVADRYSAGRVFLVGDSAHIMPPWGGLNGNTGLADAHNLVWKLAAVIRKSNSYRLLDSYHEERRPVAQRNANQAQLRSDYELRFGIRTERNANQFRQIRDGGDLLMRYRYGLNDTVEQLQAQEGTRFPHAWIERNGMRLSTLDLFGDGPVTLGGPTSTAKQCLRAGKDFNFIDPGSSWSSVARRSDWDVVEVRPDGFIEITNATHS